MDYIKYSEAKANDIALIAHDLKRSTVELRQAAEQMNNDAKANSVTAAQSFFFIKEAYSQLDEAVKMLYAVKDFLDKAVVPSKMEADGVDMVRIPELARSFSKQSRMSASFLDKEGGFKWLRDIGQGDIIQETVNAQTLASFVRSMIIEEGVDPPADIVKVSTYNTTSINKYTPK